MRAENLFQVLSFPNSQECKDFLATHDIAVELKEGGFYEYLYLTGKNLSLLAWESMCKSYQERVKARPKAVTPICQAIAGLVSVSDKLGNPKQALPAEALFFVLKAVIDNGLNNGMGNIVQYFSDWMVKPENDYIHDALEGLAAQNEQIVLPSRVACNPDEAYNAIASGTYPPQPVTNPFASIDTALKAFPQLSDCFTSFSKVLKLVKDLSVSLTKFFESYIFHDETQLIDIGGEINNEYSNFLNKFSESGLLGTFSIEQLKHLFEVSFFTIFCKEGYSNTHLKELNLGEKFRERVKGNGYFYANKEKVPSRGESAEHEVEVELHYVSQAEAVRISKDRNILKNLPENILINIGLRCVEAAINILKFIQTLFVTENQFANIINRLAQNSPEVAAFVLGETKGFLSSEKVYLTKLAEGHMRLVNNNVSVG